MKKLLSLALFISSAFAQITVTSVTGIPIHGDSLVIGGSNFGTKSPAAPLMWDDCEGRTLDTLYVDSINAYSRSVYSERQPGSVRNGDAIPLTHRTRYVALPYTPQGATGALTQITAPHNNSDQCISGGHYYEVGFDGNNGARDVQVTIPTAAGIGNFSVHWYAHWYYRVNSDFPTCGSLNNHKTSSIQSDVQAYGGGTYPNDFQYLNYNNAQTPCLPGSTGLNLRHQSDIGDCDDFTGNGRNNSFDNSRYEWQIWEELVSDSSTDGMRVALVDNDTIWQCLDKGAWFTNYAGQGIGSFTIGGYFRLNIDPPTGGEQSSDAHRLYDDIYIDDTFSRVMLGDSATYESCTIIEPQIPYEWGASSIKVELNQGALPNGQSYVYVFDDSNRVNVAGYQIVLGNISMRADILKIGE